MAKLYHAVDKAGCITLHSLLKRFREGLKGLNGIVKRRADKFTDIIASDNDNGACRRQRWNWSVIQTGYPRPEPGFELRGRSVGG